MEFSNEFYCRFPRSGESPVINESLWPSALELYFMIGISCIAVLVRQSITESAPIFTLAFSRFTIDLVQPILEGAIHRIAGIHRGDNPKKYDRASKV